jgi:hypothetical protein
MTNLPFNRDDFDWLRAVFWFITFPAITIATYWLILRLVF